MKLSQSDVLLHKAILDNEVIQITYGAIPKVPTCQKELLWSFLLVCNDVQDGEGKVLLC